MPQTRILLVDMPRMLCDIITEIVGREPDMQVVGTVSDRRDLMGTLKEAAADAMVLGLHDREPADDFAWLFDTQRRLAVLGVTADAHQAFLYELRPQRTALGEISPQTLLAAIRGATTRGAELRR